VLAENAGMDPIDAQVQLRARAGSGKPRFGIDVFNGKVTDMAAKNIYEPLKVKEQVINAATEAACMILRVDDFVAAAKPEHGRTPQQSSTPDFET
jgi:chaperonin GroEL (HSP60 family)